MVFQFKVTGQFGRRRKPDGEVRDYSVEQDIKLPFMPTIGTILLLTAGNKEDIDSPFAWMRVVFVCWCPDTNSGHLNTEEFYTDPYHRR